MLSNSYFHRIACVLFLDPHSRPVPVIKIEVELITTKACKSSMFMALCNLLQKKPNKRQREKVRVVYTQEILD